MHIILFFPFQLTKKRNVTIQDFKGRRYISIREFYPKDVKELRSKKCKRKAHSVKNCVVHDR
jgi:hypothetical protein